MCTSSYFTSYFRAHYTSSMNFSSHMTECSERKEWLHDIAVMEAEGQLAGTEVDTIDEIVPTAREWASNKAQKFWDNGVYILLQIFFNERDLQLRILTEVSGAKILFPAINGRSFGTFHIFLVKWFLTERRPSRIEHIIAALGIFACEKSLGKVDKLLQHAQFLCTIVVSKIRWKSDIHFWCRVLTGTISGRPENQFFPLTHNAHFLCFRELGLLALRLESCPDARWRNLKTKRISLFRCLNCLRGRSFGFGHSITASLATQTIWMFQTHFQSSSLHCHSARKPIAAVGLHHKRQKGKRTVLLSGYNFLHLYSSAQLLNAPAIWSFSFTMLRKLSERKLNTV